MSGAKAAVSGIRNSAAAARGREAVEVRGFWLIVCLAMRSVKAEEGVLPREPAIPSSRVPVVTCKSPVRPEGPRRSSEHVALVVATFVSPSWVLATEAGTPTTPTLP